MANPHRTKRREGDPVNFGGAMVWLLLLGALVVVLWNADAIREFLSVLRN